MISSETRPDAFPACPSGLIGDYLDGELAEAEEDMLRAHLAECGFCSASLREQQKLLCLLKSGFAKDAMIDPPDDFIKRVTARAEMTVSGLRRPEERPGSFLIAAAMLLFCCFALYSFRDLASFFHYSAELIDGVLVLASNFFVSLYAGVVVILRSTASQPNFRTAFAGSLAVFALLAFGAVRRAALNR
jgi:anti-sigma factor RsiW